MPPASRQTPAGPDPLEIPRRRPLGGLLNLILGVLVVAVLVVVTVTLLAKDDSVSAPDLVGLTVAEAQARADSAGLSLTGAVGPPDARVMEQEPAAGEPVDEGGSVRVSLGPGATQVAVPDVRGLTVDEARQSLAAADLHTGALVSDASSQGAAGTITRQQPEPDALVPPDSSVALWVASAATAQVPELAGLTEAEAEARTTSAGLVLQVLREVTDEVMPGMVFKQSPQPGERVVPGTIVVIVVNGAPGADAPPTVPQVDTGSTATGPVPEPYGALAAAFPFPVLYPSPLPATFSFDPSAGNPRQLSDQEGNLAFEVRYIDTARPGALVILLEGGFFELGLDEATTVDVRGFPGSLGTAGTSVVLGWQEGPTPYLITTEGLEPSEVVAFASTLVTVPPR